MTPAREIIIPRIFDAHVHLREGFVLKAVARYTAHYAGWATVMPNTTTPILTAVDAKRYHGQIMQAVSEVRAPFFRPLMTIKIREDTTAEIVIVAREEGVLAGKLYPHGLTTNSDDGVHLSQLWNPPLRKVLRAMEEVGMLLLLHGECGGERVLVTEREDRFLAVLRGLAEQFPKLKIVLEHVSTANGVKLVTELGSNVAATITAHHLYMTLNDVVGDGVRPHNMCMPIPKDFDDRDALIQAATSRNPQFFFGSDSAPHLVGNKECSRGACGVFSAPVVPQALAQLFERWNCLDRLADFTSTFGCRFYGLEPEQHRLTLRNVPSDPHPGALVQFDHYQTAHISTWQGGRVFDWSLVE